MAQPSRLNWVKWNQINDVDAQAEQAYWLNKQRDHKKNEHTEGVVTGLDVTEKAPASLLVSVAAGRALDSSGRAIEIETATDVNLTSFVPGAGTQTVYITLAYGETDIDPTYSPESDTYYNKLIQDNPILQAQLTAPTADQIELARVELDTLATQITDAAIPTAPVDDEIDMTHVEYSTSSRSASTTVEGVVELATQAEGTTGTDDERVLTPATVPFPTNHIGGLITSNGTDTDHDIDIAIGSCRDDSDSENIRLTSILTKQIDAVWAVGDDKGGLDTGSVTTTKLYAIWLIKRTDTKVVDVLFSLSFTVPTMPANYTKKRLIAAVYTDGSSNIIAYQQSNRDFFYEAPPNPYTKNPGTSGLLVHALMKGCPANGIVYYTIRANTSGATSIEFFVGPGGSTNSLVTVGKITNLGAAIASVTGRGLTKSSDGTSANNTMPFKITTGDASQPQSIQIDIRGFRIE